MSGALFGALTASNAFLIINGGKEIGNRNGIVLARTLAESAADTADTARGINGRSFFVRGATDIEHRIAGHEYDQLFGTDLHTRTAAAAFDGIDHGNAVDDRNSIIGTDGGTRALAKTACGTALPAARQTFGGDAVACALVRIFALCRIAITCTKHYGTLGFLYSNRNAHNCGDCLCGDIATDGACSGFCSTFDNCLRQGITARKAAAAAVSTG